MPELPEVETVRRGLEPHLVGAIIEDVIMRRAGLRYPFPSEIESIVGRTISSVERRSKYLLVVLDDGSRLLCHLGMTGRFRFEPGNWSEAGRHDHLSMLVAKDGKRSNLVYNDARRFGFVELIASDASSRFLDGLGPEPLGADFTPSLLRSLLATRSVTMKTALMDQRMIAGLGNIYVCEALFRAGISPVSVARAVGPESIDRLADAIPRILEQSIVAGGSTLRDYRKADGGKGEFQERFDVYGREGKPCKRDGCHGTIARIVQGGRSTFFCPECQTA